MNKHIYHSYRNLGDPAKNELQQRFKDSPVALSLLKFISSDIQPDFRNQDVVKVVYKKDLNETNYPVLENRYFKLRKKILDEINKIDKGSPDELPLEEQAFLKCKKLVFQNQKEAAFQQLISLEKECWDKNIFELLPGIIDQLVFINQSFNRIEKDDLLFQRYAKAIQLQQDLWMMIMTTRKIYELNFKSGISSAKEEFEVLEQIASKNKEYPRFALCYHHTNVYYRLSSTNFADEIDAITFHHDSFSQLSEEYPLIPHVSFRANYSQYQNFHFKNISAFYLFNKLDFAKTYEVMNELFKMVTNENSIYSLFNTESIYFNTFQAEIATLRFEEALKTVNMYMDFLRKNDLNDKLQQTYVMKIMICTEMLEISVSDFEFYMEKLEAYIRHVRKNISIQIPVGEALLLKTKLYLIRNDFTKAIESFKKAEIKEYLEGLSIYDKVKSFFSHAEFKKMNAQQKKIVLDNFQKPASLIKPEALIQLNWFQRFITKSL